MHAIPYPDRIQIAIAILCIAEAWLEQVVIKMKNPASGDYLRLNRQEHRRSAIYYGTLVLTYIVVCMPMPKWYILVFLLMAERRVFFECALKLFRDRRISLIEGDQPWDTFSRGIFGKKGGWLELLVLLIVIIGINILLHHV